MLKDIITEKVENIALAAVPRTHEDNTITWEVYLINLKTVTITGVLVSSQGYGERGGEKIRTSTLRHFFDTIEAESYTLIEPIIDEVLALTNEYWISFYENGKLFDKKYLFVPDSIRPEFLTAVPVINRKGILLK